MVQVTESTCFNPALFDASSASLRSILSARKELSDASLELFERYLYAYENGELLEVSFYDKTVLAMHHELMLCAVIEYMDTSYHGYLFRLSENGYEFLSSRIDRNDQCKHRDDPAYHSWMDF